MHHVDPMTARQPHHALEKFAIHALCRRIAGKAEDDHLRLRRRFADRALELGKKIDVACHPHRADVGPGNDRAIDMDRIARIGHQDRVAAIQRRQHQVGQAFLRSDGDDCLAVGVEVDAVARLVPPGDRATQPRYALRHRVPVGIGALHRLDQLVDDVTRRRAIRIAHAHVDDVLAAPARRHLQFGGDVEDIRRQARDARKFGHLVLGDWA